MQTITSKSAYKEQQDAIKLKTMQHELDISKQMETPQGRRIMMWFLDKLGYMQNIVATNASVYGMTAKQAVANDIVRELKKVCPESFMQMEREAQD